MTVEQVAEIIREMQADGYAVAVFTPEEIGSGSGEDVESAMIAAGWAHCVPEPETEADTA